MWEVDKLVCHIESMHKLRGLYGMPAYDVVVVDEIELVLEHFNSPTVVQPRASHGNMEELVQKAWRMITIDSFLDGGRSTAHGKMERRFFVL